VLEITGLRKRYGDRVAVDGVDLSIAAGEVCALLGPNGAGKTTLVSAVAGLRRPDGGTVTINGQSVWPDPKRTKPLLGLAPQDLGVYLVLTARENLMLFGELAGLRGIDLKRSIECVAEALELTDLLERPARQMSGGEQRRVHTAMAMLHRPPLLLLDEPTTGVDVGTRNRLLETVRQMAAEDGTAVCYSTHYLAEVANLGATVAILDRGRLVARGALNDLIREHGTSAVELTFTGRAPDLANAVPTGESGRVRIVTDDPPSAVAGILATLGPDASRLSSVEVLNADLESVFLTITGRRFSVDDTPAQPTNLEEARHVAS
jgi:ABC-2 type transport system ATP-binding protein